MKKLSEFWKKVAKTVTRAKKCQKLCIKAQFESAKHLHYTLKFTFNKPYFDTACKGENVKNAFSKK